MFELLVVDDEEMVRKGLISNIDTEDLAIERIWEAENGEQALLLLEEHATISVVITDIKMPKLNGIELIRQARILRKDLPMVIISGYNEFSYLRQAIRYGVSDYLLKPIDPIDLKEVLETVFNKQSEAHCMSTTEPNSLQDNIFYRIVEGKISRQSLQDKLQTMEFDLSVGPYQMVEICNSPQLSDTQLAHFYSLLHHTLTTQGLGRTFLHPNGRLLGLLWNVDDNTPFALNQLGLPLALGTVVDDVEGLPFSFASIKQSEQTPQKFSQTIMDVLQYIDQHFCQEVSLKQMADLYYINPSYLGALFKKELSVPFTDYVNRKRIERAVHQLKHTNLKVYEIMDEVGFSDKSYFLRLFKKHTGTTPSKIRTP